jgi:parallel beta helix pectate lyase-like protein/copper-binding protein NosD
MPARTVALCACLLLLLLLPAGIDGRPSTLARPPASGAELAAQRELPGGIDSVPRPAPIAPNSGLAWASPTRDLARLAPTPELALPPSPGCAPSPPPFNVTIGANGTVSNLSAPITRSGNTYTITGNLSGSLIDNRVGSVIEGGGHVENGTGLVVVVEIDANDSRLTNLTLLGGQYQVYAANAENVTVANVQEPSGGALVLGFCAETTEGLDLTGDSFAQRPASGGFSAAAASIDGSVGVTVTNCSFLGHYDLLAGDTRNVSLSGNNFAGPGTALWLSGITNLTERSDLFFNSTQGIGVVSVNSSSQLTWENNNFLAPPNLGIFIETSSSVTIYSNIFEEFPGGAIFLESASNLTVSQNQFSLGGNASIAINLDFASQATVADNFASGGATDLWAGYSTPIFVRNNSFQFAGFQAINLTQEIHPYLSGNTLQGSNSPAPAAGLAAANCSELELLNNSIGGWTGTGAASVRAFDLQSSRLTGNTLPESYYGMVLAASYNLLIAFNQIENGEFAGNGSGLLLLEDGNLNVSGNQMEENHIGITGHYGGDSVFDENNLSFAYAIGVEWNSFFNVSFEHNSFLYDLFGLDLKDGADFVLSFNDGSDPSGTCGECNAVYLENDGHGVIDSNNFSFTNVGIGGSYDGNLTIADNTGFGAGFVVLLGEVYNITLLRNIGSSGLEDIEVDDGTNVTLEGNRYADGVVGGFRLADVTGARVDGNLASGGYSGAFGLELSASTGVTLSNNTLSNASIGLEIDNSSHITAVANTLGGDNESFALLSDESLLFYHNNFEQDRGYLVAGTSGLVLNLSYPVGGNFWSNDTGPDTESGPSQNLAGADNIVDLPLHLPAGLADNYPLATPWSSPVVEFATRGLPTGSLWSVTLTFLGPGNGSTTLSGTSPELNFSVPYAARTPFTYSVGLVPGYFAVPRTAGSNTTAVVLVLTIQFSTFQSPVGFHETGLAAGSSWSIVSAGRTVASTSAWVNVSLTNGSYTYTVSPVAGYTAAPAGEFVVDGRSLLIEVNFSAFLFTVTFLEYGLANGTPWTLGFLGSSSTQSSKAATFELPNGTYPFTISRVSGYLLLTANGTIDVSGHAVLLQVAYAAPATTGPTPPPSSASPLLEYLLVALVVVALIAGWALGRRTRGGEEPPTEPPADPSVETDEAASSEYDAAPP